MERYNDLDQLNIKDRLEAVVKYFKNDLQMLEKDLRDAELDVLETIQGNEDLSELDNTVESLRSRIDKVFNEMDKYSL